MKEIITIPLSALYMTGVAIRHFLFDKRVLPSHIVEVPTICIGNIAVGGTGKTPMTAYVVDLLLKNGYHPAVLSRGYKRRSHGFVMADADASVESIGDEAMLLHRMFPEVPLAVCENRFRGVKQLKRQVKELDAVILDDGLQHRAIRCGFNVLLTPYDHLYIDDHMLPWGTLRDLPSRALKADAVVVTKCPENIRPIDMRVVDNRLHLPSYQQLHFARIAYAPMEQDGNPLVLCGIARPHYMMEHVLRQYPHAQLMAYPDHHKYTPQDIEAIMARAKGFDFVLTTEKDLQRLRTTDLIDRLHEQGKRLIALPIRTRFCTPAEAFDRQILTYVRENQKR
ncbi:MAG: tetraacyldisaccharide 4'-kinase [Paludibacteraceae bacterium]|nr:tetraacyldisaccharide 4'-kinase [Paludibacteraceae bacterium]